jgi:hypothetical protein
VASRLGDSAVERGGGGCSGASPAKAMSGATPGGSGGLLDPTVELRRLHFNLATVAAGGESLLLSLVLEGGH